jgi:hypothetical protein
LGGEEPGEVGEAASFGGPCGFGDEARVVVGFEPGGEFFG